MYILYSREYKCVFITFSRCWSKTLIKWVCAMNGVVGAKTHAQATNNPKLSLRYPGEFKEDDRQFLFHLYYGETAL